MRIFGWLKHSFTPKKKVCVNGFPMMRIFGWLKQNELLFFISYINPFQWWESSDDWNVIRWKFIYSPIITFQWWESSDDWNAVFFKKQLGIFQFFPMMRIFGWLKRFGCMHCPITSNLSNDENLRMTETLFISTRF